MDSSYYMATATVQGNSLLIENALEIKLAHMYFWIHISSYHTHVSSCIATYVHSKLQIFLLTKFSNTTKACAHEVAKLPS